MSGLRAIVTGATSGLGLWTAKHLAQHVDRIGIVGRNAARTEAAASFVKEGAPDSLQVDTWVGDMSSVESVRALAMCLREGCPRVDVLVNNAGAVFGPHKLSADGVELHLATNYLGHFLLTALLLDRVAASSEGRIINLTSFLHAFGRLRFDDFAYARWHHVVPAYARSKLALVLFTRELARRAKRLPLTVNCVDPGFVRTGIHQGAGPIQRQFARPLLWFAKEPQEGAEPIASLAVDPAFKGCSGSYFVRTRPRRVGRRAGDARVAAQLWSWSCQWLEPEERTGMEALLGEARGEAPGA